MTLLALAGSALLLGQQQQPPATPPQSQQGEVYTVIKGQPGAPPKLAIAGVIPLSTDSETIAAANTIADVLYDDIAYEREYYMIGKDVSRTFGKPASVDQVPLDRWRNEANADGVIVASVRKNGNGAVVQVKMYDVATGKMAFGKEYSGSIANPRQYAHTISDEIYQQQMSLHGVARTKFTFSSDRDSARMKGPIGPRDVQEIYIADYDGANARRITNTTTLNITPVWAPDGQAIVYTSYRPANGSVFGTYQDLVISWLYKGVRDEPTHGSPSNQNYLPAWSPDGSRIAFTSNRDGNPEIYVMNRDGSGLRRMTNNPSIDVTPTWSPNGNQIAWVSDRTGSPKIYVMNADGTGQRLLISDYSDRPTWSSGQFNEIAYAARTGPGYDIKIYDVATGESRKITDGIGNNQSPAFSPNGRHIAFTSTRSGKSQIFTVDRDGNNLRQITREGNNKFPNWSR